MPVPSRIAAAADEELMRAVQADDYTAFGELYDRHAALAWRLARSVCHDAGRSEDAVQEAFLYGLAEPRDL